MSEQSELEKWAKAVCVPVNDTGDTNDDLIDGALHLLKIAEEYLESIKGDNSPPEYRWNKESHGVLAVINRLRTYCGKGRGE